MRWNLCVAVLIVALAAPCASAVAGPYNFKLFGPFISAPLNLGRDALGNDTVYRGVIVALDEQGKSAVVYDTDTMRMAAAWNDGGVNFDGLPFTGGHGAYPKHQGELVFHLQAGPGWAKGETLADPREGEYPPLGPLPHEWAHYRGLYVHGSQVVMRWRVGKSEVLETPSLAESDKGPITVRSLSIERDGSPMTLALADAPEKTDIAEHVATLGADGKVSVVGIGGAPQGATLAVIDGKLVLQLPAAGGTTRFDVRYWRGAAGDAASLGGA
ncbi:MAG: hypothetical protein KDA41_04715, partial [Planctomycetales bacterium]|nr:hypothetical protein [Planctomycetales bacterium]